MGRLTVLPLVFQTATFPSPLDATASVFSFQDSPSASTLQTVWILINSALDARNACYIGYYQPANLLFLFPDNGDGTQATQMPLSGNGVLENSQCRIIASRSSRGSLENTLYVQLDIQYENTFRGGKGIWTAASNLAGAVSPWEFVSMVLPAP